MSENKHPNALPPGYELHWYRIDRVLGQGAFGITYLAHDINLDRQVAIKEYMPAQLAARRDDHSIQAVTEEQREDFEWGLKRFISEARTLTKFEHPNLVRVFNVFEMNNTAYMVMNYEVGKSLRQILKSRKSLNEVELSNIMIPLMSGLEIMHEKGFIHRDIKPGNIFIRSDGTPVLLDFGSARQTRGERTDTTQDPQTLTNFVSPGYAPIEQYAGKSDRQGAWTDIYGLGATLYKAIVGRMPLAAIERSENIIHESKDNFQNVSELAKDIYSERFLAAIDHALAFKAQDRPQTIAEWRDEFGITQDDIETLPVPAASLQTIGEVPTENVQELYEATVKATEEQTIKTEKLETEATETAADTKQTQTVSELSSETPASNNRNFLIIGSVAASIFIIMTIMFFSTGNQEPTVTKAPAPVTQPQTTEPVQEEPIAAEDPTEETVMAEAEPVMEIDNQVKIQELLRLAGEDIATLRLTSPKDNNAFDKYLAVLSLEENNQDALNGIQAISDKYVQLTYRAIETNKLKQAESYLSKAAKISPNSDKVPPAQQALQTKLEEQRIVESTETTPASDQPTTETAATESQEDEESSEGFMENLKDWYKKTAKGRPPADDNTASGRVVRSLGGEN